MPVRTEDSACFYTQFQCLKTIFMGSVMAIQIKEILEQELTNRQSSRSVWQTAVATIIFVMIFGVIGSACGAEPTNNNEILDPKGTLIKIEKEMGGKGSLQKLISLDENYSTLSPGLRRLIAEVKACLKQLEKNVNTSHKKIVNDNQISASQYLKEVKNELNLMMMKYLKFKSGDLSERSIEKYHEKIKNEIGGHLTFKEMKNFFEKNTINSANPDSVMKLSKDLDSKLKTAQEKAGSDITKLGQYLE